MQVIWHRQLTPGNVWLVQIHATCIQHTWLAQVAIAIQGRFRANSLQKQTKSCFVHHVSQQSLALIGEWAVGRTGGDLMTRESGIIPLYNEACYMYACLIC